MARLSRKAKDFGLTIWRKLDNGGGLYPNENRKSDRHERNQMRQAHEYPVAISLNSGGRHQPPNTEGLSRFR